KYAWSCDIGFFSMNKYTGNLRIRVNQTCEFLKNSEVFSDDLPQLAENNTPRSKDVAGERLL
ncbi:MAG: hypothetical protein WA821_14670, partial [Anaerolineales bacterium]